jgi:hypothetical protein
LFGGIVFERDDVCIIYQLLGLKFQAIVSSRVTIQFTDNLSPHLTTEPIQASGDTVLGVPQQIFLQRHLLQGYLLDDSGELQETLFLRKEREEMEP